jgi:acyl carrier protein
VISVISRVRRILGEVLQLGDRAASMESSTALIGALPEFDSMAIVHVITALEEEFEIVVDDDDISGETFETLGSLTEFIESKLD